MKLKLGGYIAITVLLIGLLLFPLIRASLYRPLPDSLLVEQAEIRERRDDIAQDVVMVKHDPKRVTPDELEAMQRDYARVVAAQNSLLNTLQGAIRSNQTIADEQISAMTAQVNSKARNLVQTPAWRKATQPREQPDGGLPDLVPPAAPGPPEPSETLVIEAVQKVIETWEKGWTRMDELNERAIDELKGMRWVAWEEV